MSTARPTLVLATLCVVWTSACSVPRRWVVRTGTTAPESFVRQHLEEVEPLVLEHLGLTPRRPGQLVLEDHELGYVGKAFTWGGGIVLARRCVSDLPDVLGHELTHWHLRREPWFRLPPALVEGLADLIARRVTGDQPLEPETNPERLRRAATMTRDEWEAAPLPSRFELYAAGETLATLHGIQGLHTLCTNAATRNLPQIPPEDLLPSPPPTSPPR